MKTMEKAGWILFLSGLAIFLITLVYGFGKWVLHWLVDMFRSYNDNIGSTLLVTIFVMIAGAILIRSGSSQDGQGGAA